MWRKIVFAAALVGAAGCGEKFTDVSGTVTYGGKPLPAGVIWFDPVGDHGMTTAQGYTQILEGQFDTKEVGRGIRPGPYLIRIEGFDGKPGPELPLGKPLFSDYQERRELSGGPITLELNVPAKKK